MTDGISALEGFDYQAMVAVEMLLNHFDERGPSARVRPEGVDDIDLEHTDGTGTVYQRHVQVKKPRQHANGSRAPEPWSLRQVVEDLLTPRWALLREEECRSLIWALGDELGRDALALFLPTESAARLAARCAAAELIVRNGQNWPRWENPFSGGAVPSGDVEQQRRDWTDRFRERMQRAGREVVEIDRLVAEVEATCGLFEQILPRIQVQAPYAEASELRSRLTAAIVKRYGLQRFDVEDMVFRNLRGFVDDMARTRGSWIDSSMWEEEVLRIWPRRIATVSPPPLPEPHLGRPEWIRKLSTACGSVVGPSGVGKTTSATELFYHLRGAEPETIVLYAEVRGDTSWRNVLEGVAVALGRRGSGTGLKVLPSVRDGNEEALLRAADALEEIPFTVALVVDLVEGNASSELVRDLARFVQRSPGPVKTRLWVFGQEDALAELSAVERQSSGLAHVSVPGLLFEEFVSLARLHNFDDRQTLWKIHEALSSGRDAGVPPRIADAVLRLGSLEEALLAADSDDVLLEADAARYRRLGVDERTALGALACFAHPFRLQQAETVFPNIAVNSGSRAGLRAGLLHDLGGGRFEFHETVRKSVLAQLPSDTRRQHNLRLADARRAVGDFALEAHYSELAGENERARSAAREAFFDPSTADRVASRVVERGWVEAREVIPLLDAKPNGPYGWWRALHQNVDDENAEALLGWWREALSSPKDRHRDLWQIPAAVVSSRPDMHLALLDVLLSSKRQEGRQSYGAIALASALLSTTFNEGEIVRRFSQTEGEARQICAELLLSIGSPNCWALALVHFLTSETMIPDVSSHARISADHVSELCGLLPLKEDAEMLISRDWGFGTIAPFLSKHHAMVGDAAATMLRNADIQPGHASIALRLLGLTGHSELFDFARRWGRVRGVAQGTAVFAPLLVDEVQWRNELASWAVDASLDDASKEAALWTLILSGDTPSGLRGSLERESPEFAKRCRALEAISFGIRPSLLKLSSLIEELSAEPAPNEVLIASLMRATHFADGPHAGEVATQVVKLLDLKDPPELTIAALHVLTRLRQPVAFESCGKLAAGHAGSSLGSLAAVAVAASRPPNFCTIRNALEANPSCDWLHSALIARFEANRETPLLLSRAKDAGLDWSQRRRALLSIEPMPFGPATEEVVRSILKEQSLLGAADSLFAQTSQFVAELALDVGGTGFSKLSAQGEDTFTNDWLPIVESRGEFFPATRGEIDKCLRTVWNSFQAQLAAGLDANQSLTKLVSSVQQLQLQLAAVAVASLHNKVEVLEDVVARSDVPWLVLRAASERRGCVPRGPEAARHCLNLALRGPLREYQVLHAALSNVFRDLLEEPALPRAVQQADAPPILSANEVHDYLDAKRVFPPGVRIAEMDAPSLRGLIARLDPRYDHQVVVTAIDDEERTTLRAQGVSMRPPPTTHTTPSGDARQAARARLLARFPERAPSSWWTSLAAQGLDSMSQIIDALADEGSPARALAVLNKIPDTLDKIRLRWGVYKLGRIADGPLVEWFAARVGAGGGEQVARIAEFAREASADGVVPLLSALMMRIAGHFRAVEVSLLGNVDDPWRVALSSVLSARRLRDVPGASDWLHDTLEQTRCSYTRRDLFRALARFPSGWFAVEREIMTHSEYGGVPADDIALLERAAQKLFWAIEPSKE